MGWTTSLSIGLIIIVSNVNAQYVLRRDFPSVSQHIPVTNVPEYLPQINPWTLPKNNVAYNNEEVKAKLVTAIEKLALANNVLSNLNTILNTYITPAAKLAKASALTGMGAPLTDFNTALTRLRVPIVEEVPIRALRVAQNLPIANLAGPISRIPNNVQVYGRGVNYQSVTGVPLNNAVRVPINNVQSIPLNRLIGAPVNAVPIKNPGNLIYNFGNAPWDTQGTPSVNRMPVNNIENVPLSTLVPTINYLQRPITNFPATNANSGRVPIVGFGNIPLGNLMNSPYSYVQRPSINLNNIGNIRINDLIDIPFDRFANLLSNRLPRSNTRISDCYAWEQMPLASSGTNNIIANVPIVPLNSLTGLPAYKGLPVIKISESVYRLTPVDV